MRFSFSLLKKLAPGKYTKENLVEKLNLRAFETVDLGGDVLDITVLPNRFSDAASHWGLAQEIAALYGIQRVNPIGLSTPDRKEVGMFSVRVKDPKLCRRYLSTYVADIKIGPSPDWLKELLEACGIRSINNVVDVMNYVMLEIGQPMHAFDADKIEDGLIIRKAKAGEKIETLDDIPVTLNAEMLVVADIKKPLAIAGIKGGKSSGVSLKTMRLLVTSANYDGTTIYNGARTINLKTDASVRFAHDLSPELAMVGMQRALQLLKEITHGTIYGTVEVYPKKASKKLLAANAKTISRLVGKQFSDAEIQNILESLGFVREKKLWRVPPFRTDINASEDIAEEVIRVSGYDALPAVRPAVALGVATEDELIVLKDKLRGFFKGAGVSEVYNYSFVAQDECGISPSGIFGLTAPVAIANPISNQFSHLRDNLAPGLMKNLRDNGRFYDEVRMFEIGKIFGKDSAGAIQEKTVLGVVIAAKNATLEMKGIVDALFGQLGLTDYIMPDLNLESKILNAKEALRIESDEHEVLGYMGSLHGIRHSAIAEIDIERLLKIVEEEREFKPLSKYPSVTRDLSVLVSRSVRVGEILALLQNVSPKLIQDVDLIDFFEDEKLGEDRKSITFRIVFQSEEKTLTDGEVDKEMAILTKVVEDRFDAEIR